MKQLGDALRDTVQILQHLVVPEAQHTPAVAGHVGVAGGIGRAVLGAVDLDDEPGCDAGEVGDVGRDRMLAAEMGAFELAGAQDGPEAILGLGGLAPELAGAVAKGRVGAWQARPHPGPPPLARWREGDQNRK